MRIAFLTAGGIAPCLTASIGSLIKEYTKVNNAFEFIGYLNGYKGLLKGYSVKLDDFSIYLAEILTEYIHSTGLPIAQKINSTRYL